MVIRLGVGHRENSTQDLIIRKRMIKSYFFLLAGLLALIAATGHAVVGHQSVLSGIEPGPVRHAVFLFLHQTTWFMLASSIILVGGSLLAQPSRISPLAAFVAIVFAGNFLFFVVSSLLVEREALSNLLPQLVFLVLYVGLIVGGIVRVRSAG